MPGKRRKYRKISSYPAFYRRFRARVGAEGVTLLRKRYGAAAVMSMAISWDKGQAGKKRLTKSRLKAVLERRATRLHVAPPPEKERLKMADRPKKSIFQWRLRFEENEDTGRMEVFKEKNGVEIGRARSIKAALKWRAQVSYWHKVRGVAKITGVDIKTARAVLRANRERGEREKRKLFASAAFRRLSKKEKAKLRRANKNAGSNAVKGYLDMIDYDSYKEY